MPANSSLSAITLKAVGHKTPDGAALFSKLDVSFPAGRTGLVGRNGIGKSTLLHLISGRLPLQTGSIQVAGLLRMLAQDPTEVSGGTVQDLFGCRCRFELLARIDAGSGSADDLEKADWTLPTRFAEALETPAFPTFRRITSFANSAADRSRARRLRP